MTKHPAIAQEIIDLYDDYTHRTLDRRGFLDKLVVLAGGTAAAYSLLPLLEANYAAAAIIAPDDGRLTTSTVTFGDMSGYLAVPADASGPLPAVVVVHENRGLNPHIQDVARRAALAGFVALAPDFLAPVGGTPADPDEARTMIRALDGAATVQNALAAIGFVHDHPVTTGAVGAVGFCWGGGLVNQMAVHSPDLKAAVPFYGRVADAADVPTIKARLMLQYAGNDDRINAGIPAYQAALDAAGIDYTLHMYDGVNHAFHNDTAEARYNKEAAELAWSRTIAFFDETLR